MWFNCAEHGQKFGFPQIKLPNSIITQGKCLFESIYSNSNTQKRIAAIIHSLQKI